MEVVTREQLDNSGVDWVDYWWERYENGEITEEDFKAYANMDTVVLMKEGSIAE